MPPLRDPHAHLVRTRLLDISRYQLVGRPAKRHPVHDWHELIYVVQGRYRVVAGDRHCTAGPGECVHHPAGTAHAPASEALTRYSSYILTWRGPGIGLAAPGPTADPGGSLLICLELLRRIHADGMRSPVREQALLVATLAEAESLTTTVPADRLALARNYLHDHFARPTLGVAEVATLVDLSRVHLSRRFRDRYGGSPGAYLRQIRLAAAVRHLVAGDRTVAEIAQAVGYRDGGTLARALKAVYGRTPSDFRPGRKQDR